MLLVDDRGGSEGLKAITRDLLKPLLAAGLPAQIARLDAGDLAFIGKGAKGAQLDIGIELKRLDAKSTDLTQSLMSGRLSEQAGRMRDSGFDYNFLLMEGQWRHNDAGQITVYQGPKLGWVPIRGGMTASELEKRVLTLELCGGMHVRHTNSRRDSVRYISSLYHWFCDRSMDSHTSHLAVHTLPTLFTLSDFRKAVNQWPGIGVRNSLAVERHFKASLRRAAMAGIDEWSEIVSLTDAGKPRRLGKAFALKLVSFLNGESK